ncbi:MAG: LamG-like jellyroll fold domain-containing protein [Verrucomicrobiota bacterium]
MFHLIVRVLTGAVASRWNGAKGRQKFQRNLTCLRWLWGESAIGSNKFSWRACKTAGGASLLFLTQIVLTAQIDPSTLLRLKCDGTLTDESSNGAHGVWRGQASFAPGFRNLGLQFSPAGQDYVIVPSACIKGQHPQLTISLWAKKADPNAAAWLIYKHVQFGIQIGARHVLGFLTSASGATTSVSHYNVTAIQNTDWHRFVLRYDGVFLDLSVDGESLVRKPMTGLVSLDNYYDLHLGKYPWGGGFNGMIDEIEISEATADQEAPVIFALDPAPGAQWVSPETALVFRLLDRGRGVDPASIRLTVNGQNVRPAILDRTTEMEVTYTPPTSFAFDSAVSIWVSASDWDGNSVQQSYRFRIRSRQDRVGPRAHIFAWRSAPDKATVYAAVTDFGTGMGAGAQAQFRSDTSPWAPPQAFQNIVTLHVPGSEAAGTLYARFSDVAGNWSETVSCDLKNRAADLIALPHAVKGVLLTWTGRVDATEAVIRRSERLGWSGTLSLAADARAGERDLIMKATAGLNAGDWVFVGPNHYSIEAVLNGQTLRLSRPLTAAVNANGAGQVLISGGWSKDYSAFQEIGRSTDLNRFIDSHLALETDSFYTVEFLNAAGSLGFTDPVHVRWTEAGIVNDAALGCSGGYAFKRDRWSGETPALIDGNPLSMEAGIQLGNPQSSARTLLPLGFHRFVLAERVPIVSVEIEQAIAPDRFFATRLQLIFDNQSKQFVNLETDPQVLRLDQGGYRSYRIPIGKTSGQLTLLVEEIGNGSGKQPITWRKVSIYSDRPQFERVTSAAAVENATVEIDFSRLEANLPTGFGTDEVFWDVDGFESGWMLKSWESTRPLFNVYRFQAGDYWPHEFCTDLIRLANLASNVTASATTLPVTDPELQLPMALVNGTRLRIDQELMTLIRADDLAIAVTSRGLDSSVPSAHATGASIFAYRNVGQLGRLQEALPEFPVTRHLNAYRSGIPRIPFEVPLNDPSRTAVQADVAMTGTAFNAGDVLRIGSEAFQVVRADADGAGQMLTLRRGFDGTSEPFIQASSLPRDVYKIIGYEPAYSGFKNNPADAARYYWNGLRPTLDKIIRTGGALPWIISWGPRYTTFSRGLVKALEPLPQETLGGSGRMAVLVDEYNERNDDEDWWYYLRNGNTEENDLRIAGNAYQFRSAHLHFLTGSAAGKVFFVRSHSTDRLRVVRQYNDSIWSNQNPEYVDLFAEGVRPGDAYVSKRAGYGNPTRKFWQYHADVFYNLVRFIRTEYAAELAGRPLFMEFFLEPDHADYGMWTLESYLDCYNLFARTLRFGRQGLGPGFTPDEVKVGAGALAGGLRSYLAGAEGDYGTALAIVERAQVLDFLSHHHYDMGLRTQQRERAWEYAMLRSYGRAFGKELMLINSEDNYITTLLGGMSRELSDDWTQIAVPYWGSNLILSQGGDFGADGSVDLMIQHRLYSGSYRSFGLVSKDDAGQPVFDPAFWSLALHLPFYSSQSTGTAPQAARTLRSGDTFGWVRALGTIDPQSGACYIHVVNRKDTDIWLDLRLSDAAGQITGSARLQSIIGGGPERTMAPGYHPIDYTGATGRGVVLEEALTDLRSVRLRPFSSNLIRVRER